MRFFFFNMIFKPEVQLKAQEGLDRVCPDRLVKFSDRPDLPYVESILMEVYRWHTVFPFGIPHLLDEDDVFEGKRLPKGCILLPNLW